MFPIERFEDHHVAAYFEQCSTNKSSPSLSFKIITHLIQQR